MRRANSIVVRSSNRGPMIWTPPAGRRATPRRSACGRAASDVRQSAPDDLLVVRPGLAVDDVRPAEAVVVLVVVGWRDGRRDRQQEGVIALEKPRPASCCGEAAGVIAKPGLVRLADELAGTPCLPLRSSSIERMK